FNFHAFLPFILESHGYSPEFSARCISNSSIMSLASQMFIIFTIDHRWFKKRFLLVASTLIVCGTNIGFTMALGSEKILTALSLFYGLGTGMFFSIFYAILIDVVGLHLYPESLAVNAL
ncbi:Major facilitator superfamily domain, partial [Trinorchestia longiramus]